MTTKIRKFTYSSHIRNLALLHYEIKAGIKVHLCIYGLQVYALISSEIEKEKLNSHLCKVVGHAHHTQPASIEVDKAIKIITLDKAKSQGTRQNRETRHSQHTTLTSLKNSNNMGYQETQ